MIYFVSVIHVLTCLFVVLFILLQDPKGGVLGSLAGGSAQSFFGAEGASPFLVKITKWLTIIFACSSFYLSYMSSQTTSIMEGSTNITQPLSQPGPSNKQETNSKNQPEGSNSNPKPATKTK